MSTNSDKKNKATAPAVVLPAAKASSSKEAAEETPATPTKKTKYEEAYSTVVAETPLKAKGFRLTTWIVAFENEGNPLGFAVYAYGPGSTNALISGPPSDNRKNMCNRYLGTPFCIAG